MIKFGTGGFRGIIDKEFNDENLLKIANAVLSYMLNNNLTRKLVISYDFRYKSQYYANLLADYFSKRNIEVFISKDPTPTPVLMYMTKKMELDLGIMITASHNPANYNGIKLIEKGGVDASVITTTEIEKYIFENEIIFESKYQKITKVDFLQPYFEFLLKFIKIDGKLNFKVLYDCIHGTSVQTIPFFKKYFKLENLTIIRTDQDYTFGNSLPNPKKEILLKNKETQMKSNYKLVMGADSDADRLGILDDNGNYVDNNLILAVIYYYLVKYRKQKGDVVKNIATSDIIDVLANKLGYKCHTVDVGFKNISSKMLETNSLIGGESSGGLTIRDYIMGKDSTLSSLLILEIIINLDKKLSDIIQEVKTFCKYDKTQIEDEVTFLDKDKVIEYIKKEFPKSNKFSDFINLNNNYKYIFNNFDWILFRFSGTEPVLRIIYETSNCESANKLISKIKDKLKDL